MWKILNRFNGEKIIKKQKNLERNILNNIKRNLNKSKVNKSISII